MWRFIVEVNKIFIVVENEFVDGIKTSFFHENFLFLFWHRYRIQSTQTHFGRMFEEFCRFIWNNAGQCIMHCYIGGNVGRKYVRFIRIYVQRWSACVTGGTQQFFEGSGKSSGTFLNHIPIVIEFELWN